MSNGPLLRLVSAALCASLAFLGGARVARADDPPPAEKKDYDDVSIFKDWKLVQARGVAHAKERAEYWEPKALAGKDWVWLGCIYSWADEPAKGAEKLEQFLKYVPDDAKTKETVEKNHEKAYEQLMMAYGKAKEWAKVADAADRYRKEYPAGAILAESWEIEGRAARLAGDEDKAMAAFKNAADLKMRIGVADLVDIQMANGKIDDAKATLAKYMQEEIVGKEQYFGPLVDFLNVVGTPAPSLAKAISVGKAEAPADWKGKPAVFYFWTMQTNGGDKRLQRVEAIRRMVGDQANFAGISTYNKYNPQSNHLEDGMTEAQEIDWYKAFFADTKYSTPPCIVVPKDILEQLRQKFEGQYTLIDGEGKFRWIRITDMVQFDKTTYEMESVAIAAKKAAAAAPTTGGK